MVCIFNQTFSETSGDFVEKSGDREKSGGRQRQIGRCGVSEDEYLKPKGKGIKSSFLQSS